MLCGRREGWERVYKVFECPVNCIHALEGKLNLVRNAPTAGERASRRACLREGWFTLRTVSTPRKANNRWTIGRAGARPLAFKSEVGALAYGGGT